MKSLDEECCSDSPVISGYRADHISTAVGSFSISPFPSPDNSAEMYANLLLSKELSDMLLDEGDESIAEEKSEKGNIIDVPSQQINPISDVKGVMEEEIGDFMDHSIEDINREMKAREDAIRLIQDQCNALSGQLHALSISIQRLDRNDDIRKNLDQQEMFLLSEIERVGY